MFEYAVIRMKGDQSEVDLGTLAETMLFYQNVELQLTIHSLMHLLTEPGPDVLYKLMDRPGVSVTMQWNTAVATTETQNAVEVHNFITGGIWQYHQKRGRKVRYSKEEMIQNVYEEVLGKSRSTRRMVRKFIEAASLRTPETLRIGTENIETLARSDLRDDDYRDDAIRCVVQRLCPDVKLPRQLDFRVVEFDDGFTLPSDLDFSALNRGRTRETGFITPIFLALQLFEARADMAIAADRLAELVTSTVISDLLRSQFRHLIEKRDRNLNQVQMFQDIHLTNARAIRDAINSKERTIEEFLALLDRAERFKDFIKDARPNETLLGEYQKASFGGTWADRLPAKILRFVIFGAAGQIADFVQPGAGLPFSAADAFIFDRLAKGWRPNQFVEGDLRKFVTPSGS